MNQVDEQHSYTSPEGWFELQLPPDWLAEMEGESSTLYYNPQGAGGILRVTALAITGPEGDPANMVAILQEKWKKAPEPPNFFASFTDRQGAVRYDQEREEDGIPVHQRFWELAQSNLLLVFSFACEANAWNDAPVQQELETATGIVASVRFLR